MTKKADSAQSLQELISNSQKSDDFKLITRLAGLITNLNVKLDNSNAQLFQFMRNAAVKIATLEDLATEKLGVDKEELLEMYGNKSDEISGLIQIPKAIRGSIVRIDLKSKKSSEAEYTKDAQLIQIDSLLSVLEETQSTQLWETVETALVGLEAGETINVDNVEVSEGEATENYDFEITVKKVFANPNAKVQETTQDSAEETNANA